jgi:putative membrane protein
MQPNEPPSDVRRWPRRHYEVGSEPDPRFTLANERTFLAWLRTSLALMAGGVGVEALNVVVPGGKTPLQTVLAIVLLLTGVLCSAGAFGRWVATERALRTGEPLPVPKLAAFLGYALAAVGLIACVLVLISGL